jgi:hypothetical protein
MKNDDDEFIRFLKEAQEKASKLGLSEDVLNKILEKRADFYADKAISKADKIWDKKGLSNEDMEKWLNQNS